MSARTKGALRAKREAGDAHGEQDVPPAIPSGTLHVILNEAQRSEESQHHDHSPSFKITAIIVQNT